MRSGGVFLYAAQQNVGGALGKDGGILPDRRQPRHGVAPQHNAVVPGHRHVLRHAQAAVLQRTDRTQRHQVGHGKNRRQAGAFVHQLPGGLIALLHREVREGVLRVKVERQPQLCHGVAAAG